MSFWTRVRRPLIGAIVGGGVGGGIGAGVGLAIGLEADSKQNAKAKGIRQGVGAGILQTQAAAQADIEKAKAIAAESVRLQEEKDRKRTLFGGEALGATAERKSLLGL